MTMFPVLHGDTYISLTVEPFVLLSAREYKFVYIVYCEDTPIWAGIHYSSYSGGSYNTCIYSSRLYEVPSLCGALIRRREERKSTTIDQLHGTVDICTGPARKV